MHRVARIDGDGIGPEIIDAGVTVLDAAGERFNFDIDWVNFDIGSERYLRTGELLTEEDITGLEACDSIYFGALGDDRVKPGIIEKGILLALRFHFDQYINLRPIKLLDGVTTPLANKKPEDIDFLVVRENTEDFYVGIGSRFTGSEKTSLEVIRNLYSIKFGVDVESDATEVAYQIGLITREGAERVINYAFERAQEREKSCTSVDKANVLSDIYGLWREVFTSVSGRYPDVKTDFTFVDAVTMWFVKNPEWFDVVVTPNMFGDIITDLGAMIQGGLGLAPGGNINPDGISMFEPIHGSAPKYKGMNIANPLATIWAGALLLENIGEKEAADAVIRGIESSIIAGHVTKDMGGSQSTSSVGDWIAEQIRTGA
ncbi:3-isopropylmalate dehydrogenase [Methanocalculus alkaliphilus]|uniref:3-isopropylmalate dehydrogenase n=1 Tax=Methanocalculus alkaliphilus TaxID=768730 RepID=UPI00209CEA42|nr:3-isopropylmalate dehydrogenase [Methanocalculus alkaliphilus]MCP1714824.1 3-isopropylmalate dehydrogenase [Methanocalculus alkaliphilus]